MDWTRLVTGLFLYECNEDSYIVQSIVVNFSYSEKFIKGQNEERMYKTRSPRFKYHLSSFAITADSALRMGNLSTSFMTREADPFPPFLRYG